MCESDTHFKKFQPAYQFLPPIPDKEEIGDASQKALPPNTQPLNQKFDKSFSKDISSSKIATVMTSSIFKDDQNCFTQELENLVYLEELALAQSVENKQKTLALFINSQSPLKNCCEENTVHSSSSVPPSPKNTPHIIMDGHNTLEPTKPSCNSPSCNTYETVQLFSLQNNSGNDCVDNDLADIKTLHFNDGLDTSPQHNVYRVKRVKNITNGTKKAICCLRQNNSSTTTEKLSTEDSRFVPTETLATVVTIPPLSPAFSFQRKLSLTASPVSPRKNDILTSSNRRSHTIVKPTLLVNTDATIGLKNINHNGDNDTYSVTTSPASRGPLEPKNQASYAAGPINTSLADTNYYSFPLSSCDKTNNAHLGMKPLSTKFFPNVRIKRTDSNINERNTTSCENTTKHTENSNQSEDSMSSWSRRRRFGFFIGFGELRNTSRCYSFSCDVLPENTNREQNTSSNNAATIHTSKLSNSDNSDGDTWGGDSLVSLSSVESIVSSLDAPPFTTHTLPNTSSKSYSLISSVVGTDCLKMPSSTHTVETATVTTWPQKQCSKMSDTRKCSYMPSSETFCLNESKQKASFDTSINHKVFGNSTGGAVYVQLLDNNYGKNTRCLEKYTVSPLAITSYAPIGAREGYTTKQNSHYNLCGKLSALITKTGNYKRDELPVFSTSTDIQKSLLKLSSRDKNSVDYNNLSSSTPAVITYAQPTGMESDKMLTRLPVIERKRTDTFSSLSEPLLSSFPPNNNGSNGNTTLFRSFNNCYCNDQDLDLLTILGISESDESYSDSFGTCGENCKICRNKGKIGFLCLKKSCQDACLRPLRGYYSLTEDESLALNELSLAANCSFQTDNPRHEFLLKEYWMSALPDVPYNANPNSVWLQLGFQGNNPRTDFRGGGVLSLACMEFKNLVHEASILDGYPFSAGFINVTFMLIICFRLNPTAKNCSSGCDRKISRKALKAFARLLTDKSQHAFEELFCCCCICLHQNWKILSQNSTLMDFGKALRRTKVLESRPTHVSDLRSIYEPVCPHLGHKEHLV